jgi:(E)-4-hydroxy-3-methylbut-2-enyl-diphosphate synthase
MKFCQPFGYYSRFSTHEVKVGTVGIGGKNPIRIQSMVNTPTEDTAATVLQCKKLSDAGCELIRITVKNMKDVLHFRTIKQQLLKDRYTVPLIADVHFNPRVAIAVAEFADKVRVNPGNFSDVSKSSQKKSFSESQFDEGVKRIHRNILPLIEVLLKNKTALRLGVNHGSLSWRLAERYGNGPAGMVETAMEFLNIFKAENFSDVVVSMKASNPFTMIYSTRMLVQRMHEHRMTFPLHLGVTEAGFGDEGIFRSAIGTGTLLCDGIGDTIRVSLSGNPVSEIPVCKEIIRAYPLICGTDKKDKNWPYSPFGNNSSFFGKTAIPGISIPAILEKSPDSNSKIINTKNKSMHDLRKEIAGYYNAGNLPVFLKSAEKASVKQAIITGALLADKLTGGWIVKDTEGYNEILCSSGMTADKTTFISCPTCGRTSYNLEAVAMEVKERTRHFPGLRIAIMGCIVNGPGEMENADYGILGEPDGKVSIYKDNVCIRKHLVASEAASILETIIKESL